MTGDANYTLVAVNGRKRRLITTRQQLVNAVAAAMARQGWRRSVVRLEDGDEQGRYRTPNRMGDGCPIGCLMSKSAYRPSFEGTAAMGGSPKMLEAARIAESRHFDALLLQRAHDNATGETWRGAFVKLAEAWGCDVPKEAR